MAVDRREDPGEFYPGGKTISTQPVKGGGDMKHEDFADVAKLPDRFNDTMIHDKLNEVIGLLKGPVAAFALTLALDVLLGAFSVQGAGVTVQTAPKGDIYNDERIVTNVVFDATGLAEATNVYTKAETEAKIVELAPAETDPTVPAWAKAASKPTYTASEVGAIPTTGGVFNASLHLNQKLSVGTWTSSVKPYDISGGSGIAFVFGDNVQTKRSNTMTLGVGALNTNEWSFIWNGDANRMYIPGFPAMSNPYATRYNGGFHVNPSVRSGMVNPLQNFWIGDTNLNDWISVLAPTPTWDTLSGKPTFATVATSGAYSDLSGKPTIPTTAADVGAVSTNGATMTGALVMEAPIVIRGAGLAGVQFGDTVLYVLDENGLPSRILTYSQIAQTSDIPASMAWGAITGKPTTISGYGITDALKSDFASLTNNAAFTSAVAAVSPPTDTSELEARGFVRIVSDDEIYFVTITTTED